jgi:hypothetical protein
MASLDDNARRVLQVIYTHGMIRGRDVQRITKLEDADLRQALSPLVSQSFITVSGDVGLETDQSALSAYFAPLPSKEAEAQFVLRSSTEH